jgi:hypothetical protein
MNDLAWQGKPRAALTADTKEIRNPGLFFTLAAEFSSSTWIVVAL